MKRLYLVGTTADNKRLVLAKSAGAKFGSFSMPITPKLRKILRELDEGRPENLKATGGGKPAQAATAEVANQGHAQTNQSTGPTPSGSFESMTGLSRRGGSAARQEEASRGRTQSRAQAPANGSGKRGRQAPPPAPEQAPEPPKPVERRPPINSKLAPAQIQALLRQGRTAKSVATEAGAPIEWIRRLMEPILLERMGIVEEMKRVTYIKARKGPSVVPVGPSIIDNLRERGVPFPERTSAKGWSAHRPDGREWRVRFTYDHRGAARTAQWEYDPPSRSVIPLNTLATQLSWRPDPISLPQDEVGADGSTRARRAPARKLPARRSATRKPSARKPSARKATARKATARKATARKATARKATARKAAPKRSVAARSAKKATPSKPAARKPAPRKPAAKRVPARRSAPRR